VPGIESVRFTHAHADHITGIDDVRTRNGIAGRPLPAYGTEATLAEITRRFSYAFKPWKPPHFCRPVLEAAVIGRQDGDGLVKPKAFVILRDGGGGDALVAELQSHVKQRIGVWKYPRWIEFVDSLPKTATGKIQRFRLREV